MVTRKLFAGLASYTASRLSGQLARYLADQLSIRLDIHTWISMHGNHACIPMYG